MGGGGRKEEEEEECRGCEYVWLCFEQHRVLREGSTWEGGRAWGCVRVCSKCGWCVVYHIEMTMARVQIWEGNTLGGEEKNQSNQCCRTK